MTIAWIITVIAAAAAGVGVGWIMRQRIGRDKVAKAESYARRIVEEAKSEADAARKERLLEAEEEVFRLRQQAEEEVTQRRQDLQQVEKELRSREFSLERKADLLTRKERELQAIDQDLQARTKVLRAKEAELEQLMEEENRRLEQISGLTNEEAKRIQMENLLERARTEAAQQIRELRERARQTAEREAREIVLQAIQRSAVDHVVETTVSVVKLPSDDMKGRIIGREGRNIRTFEQVTGIEVLIDDTPEMVVLSGFDPVRREVARISLEKLIYDGRIHPGRIEEVVEKTREEMEEKMMQFGEQAMLEVGLHGIHHELLRFLGKLHFKTSYGQNLLQHSKEVAVLSGMMAAQIGLDATLARRAGLLHDIGKAVDAYTDGPPAEIGAEVAKRYGEGEVVINAIAYQNRLENTEVIHPVTVLVDAADAISVSRPGARREMLEQYFQRMQKLESICLSFAGVTRCYALQAGREIRVIVEHEEVDDTKAQRLADDIARKIQESIEYPGQIRVTVIREFRAVDLAR
jgi:ribonuclease Y